MAVTINGSTGITTPADTVPEGRLYPLVSGTAQASTSGSSINFTGIPSWVKRITIMFYNVSTNGASANILVRLGDSSGIVATGYDSSYCVLVNGSSAAVGSATDGLLFADITSVSNAAAGHVFITNITGNTWVMTSSARTLSTSCTIGQAALLLSSTLTQLSVVTSNGTDTFDNGSINILYE